MDITTFRGVKSHLPCLCPQEYRINILNFYSITNGMIYVLCNQPQCRIVYDFKYVGCSCISRRGWAQVATVPWGTSESTGM